MNVRDLLKFAATKSIFEVFFRLRILQRIQQRMAIQHNNSLQMSSMNLLKINMIRKIKSQSESIIFKILNCQALVNIIQKPVSIDDENKILHFIIYYLS